MADDGARRELELQAEVLGKAVARQLAPGVCFCLVLADFGEGGNMAYLSNGHRPDVLKMLDELASNVRREVDRG